MAAFSGATRASARELAMATEPRAASARPSAETSRIAGVLERLNTRQDTSVIYN
jgi:hypothetical protein